MNLRKLLALITILVLILSVSGCKRKSVEQLLAYGKFAAAEKRCAKLKGSEQIEGFKLIAAFYLKEEKYKKAADFYARAQEHIKVINSYFQGDYLAEAEKYCASLTGAVKKQCADKLGRKFFLQGNYNKAVRYYDLAGNSASISHIKAKIPLFQLIERLNRKSLAIKDTGINKKIAAFKKTLTTYIYLDRFLEWPYDNKQDPYQTAAGCHEKALRMLEGRLIPNFLQTLESDVFDWSAKSIEVADFERFKLDSVIALIGNLHRIADKQEFFTRFARMYRERPREEKLLSSPDLNYEEAYRKALEHAGTLLRDIEESGNIKDRELLKDYRSDIGIDNQVIEYISSLLDNISLRVDDIRKRSLKLKSADRDERLKETAEKLFWDFIAECGRVLHLVGQEEYQKANDLLLSSYEIAKTGLVDIKM